MTLRCDSVNIQDAYRDWNSLTKTWQSFRRRVENFKSRHLPEDFALHGFMDVSLKGRVHVHCWLYHPGMGLQELRSVVAKWWGGRSDAHVTALGHTGNITEDLENTIGYACNKMPRKPKHMGSLEWEDMPTLFCQRLLLLSRFRRRRGPRFQISLGMQRRYPSPPHHSTRKRRGPRSEWFEGGGEASFRRGKWQRQVEVPRAPKYRIARSSSSREPG